MYESPITMITNEILSEMKKQTDENIYEAVLNTGIYVDKEELIKALNYDRNQYEIGYADGFMANKWISVDEKLPERGKDVLVTVEFDNGRKKKHRYVEISTRYGEDENPYWISNNDEYKIDTKKHKVLYWQHLAKPKMEE